MTIEFLDAVGGLGVFLLGMVVMTNGLKAIAGEALRRALARFTKSPTSGAVTGAIATAIIQSSSATAVAAVGFVGAGLITFSQSLGILFGANIGTTITGWLVAIVGFKLQIGALALPLVLVGTLIHLFTRRHLSAFGLALAGFGLIFVGIDLIQSGMGGLQGIVTPASFPGDGFSGRLLLVLIGIAITLVTQSSSAGVAMALTALHAGTISFEQAAVMVIGMDVGTTATAALATIGGTTDVRRTGFAHVIYNVLTGIGAFFLVTPYTWACLKFVPVGFEQNPEIALVGFHTLFNTLGVIAVLPVAGAFARLMTWLIPTQPIRFTQRLDRSLYASPVVALDAVRATLRELSRVVFDCLISILKTGRSEENDTTLSEATAGLETTRDFLTPIATPELDPSLYTGKLSSIHVIDHLQRLIDRCGEFHRASRVRNDPKLAPLGEQLLSAVKQARLQCDMVPPEINGLRILEDVPSKPNSDAEDLQQIWEGLDKQAESVRQALIAETASGQSNAYETIEKLDALRWILRVSYHVWRIAFHLNTQVTSSGIESAELPTPESGDILSGETAD